MKSKTMTQNQKAALIYANLFGWKVFPVKNGGKRPLTLNGVKDATSEQDLINQQWGSYPHANIGIATGGASGFIVVDLDEGGEESLSILEDKYGRLPDTVESITGGGGRHILLKIPKHFKGIIKNRVNLRPGIDIRADGGYIVAPPSLHNNGKVYEWELSSRPHEVLMQEIPQWLFDLLVEKPEEEFTAKPSSHWESLMEGLSEGEGRNQAAASLAGHLFRCYVDPFLIIKIMETWNQLNNPPLENVELYRTINSIAGMERKRRQGENHEA